MQLLLTPPPEGMVILKEISFNCGSPAGISHLSYATVCLHPSVSLNNEKIGEFGELKIAVCEKTAGLRSGNSLDLNLGAVHMSRASPANRADLSHENLYFSTT